MLKQNGCNDLNTCKRVTLFQMFLICSQSDNHHVVSSTLLSLIFRVICSSQLVADTHHKVSSLSNKQSFHLNNLGTSGFHDFFKENIWNFKKNPNNSSKLFLRIKAQSFNRGHCSLFYSTDLLCVGLLLYFFRAELCCNPPQKKQPLS